ncbi:MAG: TraB family protein [bacterium]
MQKEKNVERIVIKDKEIILVGTAHISEESVELVTRIINEEKPEAVGVELCQKRYNTIFKKEIWENTKIIEIIKKGQTQLLLANLLISSFQKRMGEELKIKPGAEMIQAVAVAKNLASQIVLIDRDIQITLKRAWGEMKFLEKIKFLYILLSGIIFPEEMDKELVEKIKEKDIMTQMIEELGKEIPSVKKVLIDERDIYIANKILAAPGKK